MGALILAGNGSGGISQAFRLPFLVSFVYFVPVFPNREINLVLVCAFSSVLLDLLFLYSVPTIQINLVLVCSFFYYYKGQSTDLALFHMFHTISWEFAASLRDLKPQFDAAGVKLIAIGVGTPDKAQILAEKVCLFFMLSLLFLFTSCLHSVFYSLFSFLNMLPLFTLCINTRSLIILFVCFL